MVLNQSAVSKDLAQFTKMAMVSTVSGKNFLMDKVMISTRLTDACADLTGSQVLKFGVESKKSSPATSTSSFMQLIAESLREMREMCLNGMVEDGSEEAFVARL